MKQHQQTVALEELDEVDLEIIRERNADVQRLEADVYGLMDLFYDVQRLVVDQSPLLDEASDNIEECVVITEDATENLAQAEDYDAKRKRRKAWWGTLLTSCALTLGGAALAFVMPTTGLLTAGAGVTGIAGCIGVAVGRKASNPTA